MCVVAVLYAALLLWAYRKAGWWGVGIVLTFGVASVAFKAGADFGDKWHAEEPKKRPKTPDPFKPVAPGLDEVLKDIFNGNRKHK